jgi:hypothetical protein
MKRIPHARDVDKALKAVKSSAKAALQGLNRAAGAKMSAGNYSAAEALALKAKELQQFQVQVETLRMAWRALNRGTASKTGVTKATPLWSYYQPILKALSDAGGKGTLAELEPQVEQQLSAQLQPGDHQTMAGGRERWRVMVRRARKHLISEGWIEKRKDSIWQITEKGRRAAEVKASTKSAAN